MPERPRFLDGVLDERARLLWHILGFFLVMFVPISVIGIAASLAPGMAAAIYGGVFAVALAGFVLLLRRWVATAALVLCLMLSLLVMGVVLGVGRPGTAYAAGFIPLVLLARATLGRRGGIVTACTYVAFLAGAAALHATGHYPAQFIPATAFDETLAAAVFVVSSALFTSLTTRMLEDSVAAARSAADTERSLAAQARALAQLGSDALAHSSVQLAEDVVQQVQGLPGVRWAAVVSLARSDVSVTTRGLAADIRREIEARAPDLVGGRDLDGFATARAITRCELTLPDGPAGTLIAGFTDRATADAAASFLRTAASLLVSAMDRERRQDELIRVQKRDAAGRIAANVSHDVNNLLAAVAADAWALGQLTVGAARDLSQQILQATRRGALLTGRLRALARSTASIAEVVRLDQAVESHVATLRRRRPARVDIRLEHDGTPLSVTIDRGDLEQVLEALTSNALQAMPSGGHLTLRIGRGTRPGAIPDAAPQIAAHLEVVDDGVGMDQAVRERLYEPFFTTRETSAGLGLALTREVLERVGGTINIDSAPGQGTRVRVEVPLSHTLRAPTPSEPLPKSDRRTVLLVEDDALVRKSVARLLTRGGYAVVEAEDGLAALDQLAAHPAIGMVLSDIAMPRLGGIELARRIRAERELPVLLISGYTEQEKLDPSVPVIMKPFAPNELLDAVAHELGQATAPAPAPPEPAPVPPVGEGRRSEDAHTLFVAMVLHDINNALSVLGPSTETLREVLAEQLDDPQIGPLLEDIDEAARRSCALARQALRIANPRTMPEPLRIDRLVRELERPLGKLVHGRGRLVLELPAATRPVLADRGMLERALVNLVVNARDALDQPGYVIVAVHDPGGPEILLEVQDDGRGIEPETLPRIFEPFFTTKRGSGTGLGLTVVKAAVGEIGGNIEVESTPGRGALFRIRLPVAA